MADGEKAKKKNLKTIFFYSLYSKRVRALRLVVEYFFSFCYDFMIFLTHTKVTEKRV